MVFEYTLTQHQHNLGYTKYQTKHLIKLLPKVTHFIVIVFE